MLFGHNSSTDCSISATFCNGKQRCMPTKATANFQNPRWRTACLVDSLTIEWTTHLPEKCGSFCDAQLAMNDQITVRFGHCKLCVVEWATLFWQMCGSFDHREKNFDSMGEAIAPLLPPRKWRPWHFSAHYCDIQVSEIWCKNIQAFLRYSNFRVVWGYFILPHREHWTVNEGRLIKLSPRRIMGLFSSIALWITIGSTRSLQNLQITIYPPIPLTINHQT